MPFQLVVSDLDCNRSIKKAIELGIFIGPLNQIEKNTLKNVRDVLANHFQYLFFHTNPEVRDAAKKVWEDIFEGS